MVTHTHTYIYINIAARFESELRLPNATAAAG